MLLRDGAGEPVFSRAAYGKGRVYFLNLPLEEMLLTEENGFERNWHHIYKIVAEEALKTRLFTHSNPRVGLTRNGDYAVLVNYTEEIQNAGLRWQNPDVAFEVIYGDPERIAPCEAAILRIRKRK